jgi:hypothetical protein
VVLSVLFSFCIWALWRKPAWGARRGVMTRGGGVVTGSLSGSPGKRVRYRPRP